MKPFALCLITILLFTLNSFAQSSRKKTAVVTYISSTSGSSGGEIQLQMNGKLVTFVWDREGGTSKLPIFQANEKGSHKGAEWRIVYLVPPSEFGGNNPFILNGTFTGRVLAGVSVNGQRKTTSRAQTFDAEARRLADQFWSKYFVKCGESYFFRNGEVLQQFKGTPHYGFSGQTLQPKTLRKAEILNGMDPLPVDWDGNISISFGVCRLNSAYYGYGKTHWHGWEPWGESCTWSTRLWRKKGNWQFFQSPTQTTCDNLSGNETQKTSSTEENTSTKRSSNDLSDTYGIIGSSILNKQTRIIFRTPRRVLC